MRTLEVVAFCPECAEPLGRDGVVFVRFPGEPGEPRLLHDWCAEEIAGDFTDAPLLGPGFRAAGGYCERAVPATRGFTIRFALMKGGGARA